MSYHVRLYDNMSEYGLDKHEVANLLNQEYGSNYDESKWRKDYALYLKWKPFIISETLDEDIVKKYEMIRIETEKEKIRSQDQKREYKNLIRNQARFEKIRDDLILAVDRLSQKKPLTFENNIIHYNTNKHGLSLWSDWHYGMEIDNTFNKYNKHIFNQRIEKLVNKTIEHGKKNEISTLHIAQLGDIVSGMIHVSTRVQSNEDIIEQVKYVSETLAEVLAKLSGEFEQIKFYNVIGNHGRTGHKNDVGVKENFEYLITWYLEARLQGISNIEIISDSDGYIQTKIFDEDVIFVHGNYDRIDQAVVRLPQVLGIIPRYIFSGHIHHNYEKEYGITTVITNGSLMGVDDYAVQNRFNAKPSHKFMVFDENEGLECTYIIKLK